jgi:hypothetical protein
LDIGILDVKTLKFIDTSRKFSHPSVDFVC